MPVALIAIAACCGAPLLVGGGIWAVKKAVDMFSSKAAVSEKKPSGIHADLREGSRRQ